MGNEEGKFLRSAPRFPKTTRTVPIYTNAPEALFETSYHLPRDFLP